MSSAFYPLGMRSYNNRSAGAGYRSWKGVGIQSNPIGITSGSIRPLTNRDLLNSAPAPFGRPRPIKHYRKGIAIPIRMPEMYAEGDDITLQNYYDAATYYYTNREVLSSKGGSLGGGNGGVGMIAQMQDRPGAYIVKRNAPLLNGVDGLGEECRKCKGVGIVSDWYPINNLNEQPEPNVANPLLCCNQEYKARKRVLPASTLTNRSYYTTTTQYLYNRCNTYKQKSFAYLSRIDDKPVLRDFLGDPLLADAIIRNSKPGEPFAYFNEYRANCNCNFKIEEAAAENFLVLFTGALIDRGLIPEDSLEIGRFKDLLELVDYIRTLNQETQRNAELLFLGLLDLNANDPNTSGLIQGPSAGVKRGCARVFYKPSNPQFAVEGGVSSSTRTLKTKVVSIDKNMKRFGGARFSDAAKQKTARCEPAIYWMNGNPKANPRICNRLRDDAASSGTSSVNPKYQPNYRIFNINALTRNYT